MSIFDKLLQGGGARPPEDDDSILSIEHTVSIPQEALRDLTDSRPPALVFDDDQYRGWRFALDSIRSEYVIGRSSEADLRLSAEGVSRKHARIYVDAGGRYRLEDLESRNGVYVNNERVTSTALQDGDRITLGTAAFLFECQSQQVERKMELQKAGTVQTGVLPRASEIADAHRRMAVLCRPAAHCGGDWWWYHEASGGRLELVLCDVLGHGAAPAIVTAAVAGAIQGAREQGAEPGVRRWLEVAHSVLREFWSGQHWMAAAGLSIDPQSGQLTFFNAGLPGAFVDDGDGNPSPIMARGAFVGAQEELVVAEQALALPRGARLFLATDGILEATDAAGRQMRLKRLLGHLGTLRATDATTTRDGILEFVDDFTGGVQEDDYTFAVVDLLAR